MPYELDVQHEQLTYTGRYSRPLFELWGDGGKIVGGIYDALQPYRVRLSDIRVEPGQTTASDPIVTAGIAGGGVCRFAFDRLELTFSSFSEESLKQIPAIISASTGWIRTTVPTIKFHSHLTVYHAHAKLTGAVVGEFLKTLGQRNLKSAGIDRGSGAIYNYEIPDFGWTTQLVIDSSLLVSGGLYLMLSIATNRDRLDYGALLVQGRSYLSGILQELDLHFPELEL